MEVPLYDSSICRLCGEDNSRGVLLYSAGDSEVDLSVLVNRYLPFKVQDDGKLPCTICPGCNIQLQSTAQFFELLVEGQRKIREMWKSQLEMQRKARLRNETQGRESLLIASDQSQTSLEMDPEGEDQIVTIQIMADGGMFSSNHEIALKIDGLERPRRKRGRPPKRPVEAPEELEAEKEPLKDEAKEDLAEVEDEEDADGRKRRKRKVPQRYKEAVAGKELERIFREEGVIDENEADDEEIDKIVVGEGETEEVIGHLENHEGQDLGELIIANRGRGRGRPRGGKRRRIRFECDICGRGFQHKGRYILHRSYHKGVKYECTECNKQFSNKDNFYLHQKTVGHTGEGIVEGLADGQDASQLKTTVRFPCDQCDKTFQTKQSHEVHMKAIHEGQKPYACEVCGKNFAYHNSLKFHMAVHEEQKSDKGYPCDICGKLLNHPSSVVYHKEAEHNNGRRFVCNKCGKGFKHKQLLQRHQLVHSNERPFVCKSCGAGFKTKANLINHQPTHTGEKKYFCEMCGQQFAHKTSLTLHYRWHTGQKPYECHVCQKSFSQNGNLQEHLRIHTGEKPFCCDYCGRSFTTSSQFKLHVKRHTGERPWKCNVCGKSFLHKDTWKCHVRRHNGEKPFTCDYCARGFTEQWALKKHQRMHTGEKPYTCNVCGKAFADCSNLTKHKKVHRENKEGASTNGYAVDRTVWNIIRTHLANEVTAGNMVAGETVTGEDGDGDGVQQIIYVTYQDPDHPNESRTLHLVEDVNAEGKNQVTHGTTSDSELILGEEGVEDSAMQLKRLNESSVIDTQTLQVTDEEGNPIHFTMTDGRELEVSITSADGHSLQMTTLDGQTIPLQLMTTDGHAITTDVESHLPQVLNVVSKDVSQTQENVETNDLIAEEQAIEYTTENGQKVRIVTTYDVDSLKLESEYLTQ